MAEDLADGWANMGKSIPPARMARAYAAVKEMLPMADTEGAMAIVGATADLLERDDPYHARQAAMRAQQNRSGECYGLDLTGALRLIATLLTGARS